MGNTGSDSVTAEVLLGRPELSVGPHLAASSSRPSSLLRAVTMAVGVADCTDCHSDGASVFQEPGQLRAPHRGGGHDGDGPQAGPHVCLHLRPVAVQPPASL